MTIALRQVEKAFGPHAALAGASLDIAEGELLALLGPSGSGKTTLLRLIAGLEFPDRGQVLIDGADMTRVGPAARRAGFVFQQYALFDHMSVARNIAFGLNVRPRGERPASAEIEARVAELLRLVELDGLGERSPRRLSGGQRQRVALARALAVNPRVLLLDEPFGALDATVRKTLRKELRRIHDATGVTTVFVTHDQAEALELADRVAILNAGRIEQVGSAAEVYAEPATAFVCGFVGAANRFEGEVRGGRFRSGLVEMPAPSTPDGPASAFVRPHDFALTARGGLEARLVRQVPHGPVVQIEARLADGHPLDLAFAPEALAALAPEAVLRLDVRRSYVFENSPLAPQL